MTGAAPPVGAAPGPLARGINALRRWLRPPRILRFTRWGTYVVVLALGIGFAALNTGNNLLYILFGLLLGLILSSGIISETLLRSVTVDWLLPGELFAGRPFTLRLIVKNRSRRPLLGVETWVTFESPSAPGRETGPASFLFVPPEGQRSQDLSFTAPARGRATLAHVRIATSFPFGFFEKSLKMEIRETHVVYPAIVPIPRRSLSSEGRAPRRTNAQRGPGDTFWGLREFQEGDSLRRVAWKNAARLGRLVVQETEQESDRRVTLDLGPSRDWAPLTTVDRESALSFAASLALQKWAEGFALGLVDGDHVLPPGRDPRHRRAFLTRLALCDPASTPASRHPHPEALPVLALWKAKARP